MKLFDKRKGGNALWSYSVPRLAHWQSNASKFWREIFRHVREALNNARHVSSSSSSSFGTHFGIYFGTRSAQEEPRWVQEDHEELQSTENLHLQKLLKTICFSIVFEVQCPPRQFLKTSEDPRRLPRGYFELFGNILSHLGAILDTRAFKIAPAGFACARPPRF